MSKRELLWRRLVVPLVALLAIVTCLKTAMADQLGDEPPPASIQLARCFGTDIDLRITGCSALIDSGGGTPMNRAQFFMIRGSAVLSKGQDDRAVQDFDAAIRLDPDQAKAFLHHDLTLRLGPLGRAVADFEKACNSRPELQPCRKSRDLVQPDTIMQREFAAALASAPYGVRDLQCRDITPPAGTHRADFRKWFDQFMAPVATGISTDEAYEQLLAECTQDQNWSAVDATRQIRLWMQGLTPEHVGGK